MRKILTMTLLLLAAPLTQGQENRKYDDIVELSPGLYLLMYTSRVETYVGLRMDAIHHANDFAASHGGVVVPVMGRQSALGVALKLYEYQFRVMSREEALAARPVLADAVITVNNTGQCGANAAIAGAMHAAPPDQLKLLAGALPMFGGATSPQASRSTAADGDGRGPGTMCLPGQICNPSQICLPGFQCTPGMPSIPESATPPPAG